MSPKVDPRIIERIQTVRQWYAQLPARVDFNSANYHTEIKSNQCFICRLIQNDPDLHPHVIVAENDEFIAFLDRFPAQRGHTLVCPKEHVENIFDDITLPQYLKFQEFIYRIGQAIIKTTSPERIYLCSFGSAQMVSHIHFHLVPLPAGVPLDGQETVAMIRTITGVLSMTDAEQERLANEIRKAL
jgi:histidine triad (HIT) family protein